MWQRKNLTNSGLITTVTSVQQFDAARWDRQFEEDVAAGRLNDLAQQTLKHLREGRCTDLRDIVQALILAMQNAHTFGHRQVYARFTRYCF
ncbi:hypothetical protein [Stenomitos frigidus]|uniref:Uncharacterized protein n=1 Tax=Stenomitos frigidus ULC18 TaxID=2107698 RepID=A0A2T1DT31_9CYAN|nr:hypothetical protein [Stenomitos frigidus]PSB23642.1 hypothetical protein C7B82_30700 [Stenomitos frigidus ULC18]